MLFSLRNFLWNRLYGGGFPPDRIVMKEVVGAAIIVLLILLSWFVVRRWFFLIIQRARPARITAFWFCLLWAFAYTMGALEYAGFRSFVYMLAVMILSLIGSLITLFMGK